jgi:hypothetical protein
MSSLISTVRSSKRPSQKQRPSVNNFRRTFQSFWTQFDPSILQDDGRSSWLTTTLRSSSALCLSSSTYCRRTSLVCLAPFKPPGVILPQADRRFVAVIESITKYREPQPEFEAVYLLMPTTHNVDRIIRDFSDGTRQYAAAHLFFIEGMLYARTYEDS